MRARPAAAFAALLMTSSIAYAQTPQLPTAATIVKVPAPPATDILETVAKVPVAIHLQDGKPFKSEIAVTHFRPQGPGPFPVVVINHGRGADRADPPRARFLTAARFYTRRGFSVFVPTRIGYGEGGTKPDPEYAGNDCTRRDYGPPLAAIQRQIEATLIFAKSLPHVDASKVLLVGQSYGGMAAIHAAGGGIPGVLGAINFAGGGGGNPALRPGNPCSPEKIAGVFAAAAPRAKVPTLWLYAENDKYWGRMLPVSWHKSFVDSGGMGELVMYPPYGDDGHKILESLSTWRPKVDGYLTMLGFAPPRSSGKHVASTFAPLAAADKVPFINEKARADGYQKFLAGDLPRAFAIAPNGAWGSSWGQSPDAPSLALERCEKHAKSGCRLYAVDDKIVFVPEQTAATKSSTR